jgi:hypothetical protein
MMPSGATNTWPRIDGLGRSRKIIFYSEILNNFIKKKTMN